MSRTAAPAPVKSRRTRQLDATYEVVREAHDHPTAEEVHHRVQRQVPRVSLGTVYRNLQKLAAEGRVQTVQLARRSTRFDGMVAAHEHFVCEHCGDITDLPVTTRSVAQPPPLSRAGYAVNRSALTYYGTCPSCRHTQRHATR
ncbi:MAG: transcriptional repressor [Deltaproteobacteria bacterium]|nr:transcriptional repressor [Deltaproteobacteria bacterium]